MMKRTTTAFALLLILSATRARPEPLVQWGESPSGAGTPGTNIVANNLNMVGTSTTYSGNTNNPAVGASYYPDHTNRSPWFSATSSGSGTRIVEGASTGDRITLYANTPAGGTYRGMVMWVSNYFLSVTHPFVLTNIAVVANQRLNPSTTNQALRVVVMQGSSYYVSGGQPFGAAFSTNTYPVDTQSWFDFTPFASGTETIGGSASTPSFTNVQAVGYYFTAENGGPLSTNTGAQVSFFAAEGATAGGGPATHTLVTTADNPDGGSVNPAGGTYNAGDSVQLTATASNYFAFVGWSGDLGGTTNPVTITMDADKSITAHFSALLATNGTPHWWLASYGLSTDDAGALSDDDFDGHQAWQEYIAGTQPNAATSVFAVASVKSSAAGMVLQWPTVSGRLYGVSWSPSPAGAFAALADATNLAWTIATYTDTVHHADSQSSYRLDVRRE